MSNHGMDNSISLKAAELAQRLRLLQVDLADQPAAERQGHMAEVLERGLSGLAPESRRAVIELLTERFPSWDSNVQLIGGGGSGAAAPAAQSVTDAAELRDPSFLIARLIELSSGMTPGQKQAAAAELQKAGFALTGEGGLPESEARALQSALGHGPRDTLDAGRSLELAAVLSDFAIKLDVLMTDIWRKIAPNSTIRKSATLRVTLGRFASGDRDTARPQVEQEIALLRQITAGVASAISRAAPQFARKHLERFGATEIERAVREEGGGWGMESKCWKKYQQICASIDIEAAERELLAVIAEHAEKLIRGTK